MSSGSLFGTATPATSSKAPVTAHCDGGSRGNPGPAGYGAQITAADGTVLAELSEYLGKTTNNVAEYSGLLGVLAWALQTGTANVRVVSDSELMVKQIQGRYKVNSPDLRPLFEEAKRRIAKLDSFQITHALRHKNKDADRLANDAMDRGTGKSRATPDQAPILLAPHERPASRPSQPATTPQPVPTPQPAPPPPRPAPLSAAAPTGEMLRGFVRDGSIHLLGGKTLPDGVFVKIVQE